MDRGLIRQAQAGDQRAYESLVRGIARRLYLIAHRILRDSDAADDATQQVLVTVWKELPRLRDPERFDAWCYRLIVRSALAEARRRKRHAPLRPLDERDAVASDTAADVARKDALERAFSRLTPAHRAVIVLRYYADLPIDQIAEVLDIPYGTVGSRLSRAVTELQAHLRAQSPPDPRPMPSGPLGGAVVVGRRK